MAQEVDVKGFGLVEFPDDVERSIMLDALRRKFSQINQGQAVPNATVAPYSPKLAERAAGAISSGLQKTGLISNNYRANRIGENITMGLEALPIIGDAIGGDELGRAIRDGDMIGGGFAALGAIPVVGDLAKGAAKPAQRLITSITDLFDYTPQQLSEQLIKSNPLGDIGGGVYRENKGRFYTDYNPDGTVSLHMADGKLVKQINADESSRLFKDKILEVEMKKPEAQEFLNKREADLKAASEAKKANDQDYRMQHRAPMLDGNAAGHDLTATFGEDIYSPRALQLFGTGAAYDNKAILAMRSIRNKPDAEITIYRAAPKGVSDINGGDWVTLTKEYAEQHAKYDPSYEVISKKVKASEIATDGNSIHEFGYDPQTTKR